MKHPLYVPNLGRRDFYLFGLMSVYLGGEKFQTDYELKCGVLNWLSLGMKSIKLLASVTCQDN
jgi:hypothetical protein